MLPLLAAFYLFRRRGLVAAGIAWLSFYTKARSEEFFLIQEFRRPFRGAQPSHGKCSSRAFPDAAAPSVLTTIICIAYFIEANILSATQSRLVGLIFEHSSSMALRLHNRRLYPLVFLAAIAAIAAAWWRFGASYKPEILVSVMGGVFAFAYFLYRQHLDETKLFKDLFGDFNARYDALNNELNAILLGPREGALSVDETKCLFRYFNLCAEEFFFIKLVILIVSFGSPGRRA